jgi:2-oxoglutarate ferredoxin oxidoreductase subunit alpha
MSQRHDIVIRIGGESGEGVISTGELITLAAARAGFFVYTFRTYPAEIKGGHAVYQLRLADRPLFSQGDDLDVLLAFNQEGYDKHHRELRAGGTLLYDTDQVDEAGVQVEKKFGLPLTRIAREEIKMPLAKNMVALGAMARLVSIPDAYTRSLVEEKFKKKGPAVMQKNLEALAAGKKYIEENFAELEAYHIDVQPTETHLVLSGNEAICLGAIVAGCREYFGYPITPASDIMELLAAELPKLGGTVLQVEDEIAALAMAIGASYAGKKVMTATSGPGFSLMTELMGLAGMAEVPVVVADVQRAGPSTGMPTKMEQGDLNLAVFGCHGEAPRIVVAPMNVEDCFYQTVTAFNLAEKYQVPVVLLSDQSLAYRSECIPRPDLSRVKVVERTTYQSGNGEGYKRYAYTESGVSPMAIPGTPGGMYVATGLEHSEAGRPRYDPVTHQSMVDKRFRKTYEAVRDFPAVETLGDADAELGIVSWGSTLGQVREAVEQARAQGIKILSFYPRVVYPLANGYLLNDLGRVKRLIVPEVNMLGQFANLIEQRYRGEVIRLNIYGGLPFKTETILKKIVEVAHHG